AAPTGRRGAPVVYRRRFLLTSLAGAIAPVGGAAQGADRVLRVGILLGFRPPPEWIAGDFFFGPMRDLGWVDGQNVVFEQPAANEQPELLPMLARELIASRVDVIVASPSTGWRKCAHATTTRRRRRRSPSSAARSRRWSPSASS